MDYSSIWKRIIALIIDLSILGFFNGYFIFIGLWYIFPIIWFLYFTIFEGSALQATPGKKIVGIKIVDSKGDPIDYGTSFIRTISKLLSSVILFIGYLMAFFNDKKQALHDTLADTLVVDAKYEAKIVNNRYSNNGNASILGITGEFTGKNFIINSNGIMIGRDNTACKIVFSENAQGVSRQHCIISYNKQTKLFILQDIGSSNGTYLENNRKVLKGIPVYLKSGERFYLGNLNNTFETRG